jgi:hypothetical protein
MSLKNPVTRPGIDPGTVRLVAQRLNHYANPGPPITVVGGPIIEVRGDLQTVYLRYWLQKQMLRSRGKSRPVFAFVKKKHVKKN